MPIYEYQCQSCGHRLEAIQSFSDAPLTTCPACKKKKLHKLISAPSFHLKGTGWYATDFKNPTKKKTDETSDSSSTTTTTADTSGTNSTTTTASSTT